MSEYNYITDKKHTGGMTNSSGMAQQDLVAVKYIFGNMDKGLKYIAFEGEDDFTIYYSNGHSQKWQCKINLLTMKYVTSLCKEYKAA